MGNTASEDSRGERVDLDPQPAAWHQWSGTSPGLGPPPTQALEASPGQRTPYAAQRPEQNLALWRAPSARLGLSDLYFPYQNPELQSDRHMCTYGDKGQWSLNKSCPGTSGTSMLVCLQARAKSAHWKEGAQLGEGRWADTTSSLDGTRPNQSHSHFRFSLDWNPDKEKGDL